MPSTSLKTATRRVAIAATIGVGAFVAAPSAASAAGTNACDASALQLSLLGGAPLDPIHANPAYAPCISADGTLIDTGLLGLVNVQAVTATTRNTANVNAVSESIVTGAKVGAVGPVVDRLTGPLLDGPNSIVGQVDGLVTGLLGPITSGPLSGLIGGVPILGGLVIGGVENGTVLQGLTGNLTSALTAALPPVLSAGVISAQAQATCSTTGTAQLSGQSRIADLRVLGTTVDVNDAANRLLSIDTAKLNLGQLLSVNDILKSIRVETTGLLGTALSLVIGTTQTNLYDLLHTTNPSVLGALNNLIAGLSGGQTLGSIVTGLTNTIQPLLDSIEVNLPPGLLRAQVTPNAQSVVGDQLTQQALSLSVSALGQPILSGVLAQARVGAGAPGCVPPVTPPKPEEPKSPIKDSARFSSPEAEAYLQCSNRDVDLIDVYGTGGRTFVQGVAQRKYVGKTATIYLAHGKKKVGTVTVGEDGLFNKRVALPPSKIRKTNKARYYAVVEGKKTRALKFARRMETRGLTATSKTVTLRGRVVGPLQRRQQAVTIKQRVSCKSYKTVATVKPDSKGRFTARIDAPAGDGAVIYRAQTRVGKTKNAKRLAPTFTLPRVVGLR